ncbi:MAG TPA: M12 family metallo-peptidase [Myxococcota bacterium]|jgi:hypothetical protein
MRWRHCGAALAMAWLLATAAFAQAPNVSIPFESWAPLGAYERTAFAEEGSLRVVVPTKRRNVEIAFTPQPLRDEDYAAERVDARGLRAGIPAPGFTAYTGRVTANSGRDFAKLGYARDDGRLEGLLRIDGAFYALQADLAAADYVIRVREVHESEIAALARACAVTAEELQLASLAGTSPAAPPVAAAATQLREIELGTEADAGLVALSGGAAAANARILSIVNMVNGIYETDLGLTNRVVTQRAHTGSDPYTTTNASDLLEDFANEFDRFTSVPFDDAVLFTNRNLNGDTVGIAYIGETCRSFPFAVVQTAQNSDFWISLIAAHELGHNLGARHTSVGIMTPALSGATNFSQSSKDEIAQYGLTVSCLAPTASSGTNLPPTLVPVGPQALSEGDTLTIALSASDPEGGPIQYGASPLPVGASLSQSGVFTWTPARTVAGCNASASTTVQFTASDGTLSASESVPIFVDDANTNAAPSLTDPADRDVFVGRLVQFQLQASDADGDSLTFSASGLPAGAMLSATGGFSWTPNAAETANVTFAATDCTGLATSQSAQLSATVQPQPHLTSLSKTTGWVGEVITLSGSALSGNQVRVNFRSKAAVLQSVSDTSITFVVPNLKKKFKKAGAQPVTFLRDGVSADNALSFDYVKP